jgi:putative transposase
MWSLSMARLPRLAIAGGLHLVSQRCRSPGRIFLDDIDRHLYLDSLVEGARSNAVAIHAYVLLDDEIRILVTPRDADGLGRLMQRVGRRYVPAFNQRHGTSGALWAGRFHSAALDPEHYLLQAIRYVEQAPVRAGIVSDSRAWPWSSASHHLGQKAIAWITEHPTYWALGNTPFEREAKHEAILQQALTAPELAKLEDAVRRGWALGDAVFCAGISRLVDRPTAPGPRGRPRKRTD